MKLSTSLRALFASLIFLFVLSSCSHSPIYKSLDERKMKDNVQYIGYDSQNAIRYAISNDSANLYIRLEVLSRPAVIKIMQAGFYIYVDTLLKRNKDMWLNYPVGVPEQPFKAKLFREQDKENAALAGKLELESQVKDVARHAVFARGGTEEVLQADSLKGFAFQLIAGDYGSLNYYVAIPLNKIKAGGIKDLRQISIGFISGAFKKPNMGTAYGGGRRAGGYGYGNTQMPAGQGQNMDPQRMREMLIMGEPIVFWLKVELAKP